MSVSVDSILKVFVEKGGSLYGGEAVTQLEHALQCAALADAAGASDALITACLLHDVGHLVHNLGEDVSDRGIDDCHEHRAMPYLRPLFPDAVTEPIRLHVAAKRYLCATDSAYWSDLSPASQHSLTLQGGTFSPEDAAAFIQQPHAPEAVQLRRWDDLAKVPHHPTPPLDYFADKVRRCLHRSSPSGL